MNRICMKRDPSPLILTVVVIIASLWPACAKGPTVERFYPHGPIQTTFSYEPMLDTTELWYRAMHIATSAETKREPDGQLINRTILSAMDYRERAPIDMTITFTSQFFKDGRPFFSADIVRSLKSCAVRSVVIDGKYRSTYAASPGLAPPTIRTVEVSTGHLVSETLEPTLAGDGSFTVTEVNYRDGTEVFRERARRHAGTGLLIGEDQIRGVRTADYHHYELVLGNWSMGQS